MFHARMVYASFIHFTHKKMTLKLTRIRNGQKIMGCTLPLSRKVTLCQPEESWAQSRPDLLLHHPQSTGMQEKATKFLLPQDCRL